MGNVYTVNEILVGSLSDRPAPDRNIILYVDSATGKASLADGTTWNDFGGASLPGVTSNGVGGLTFGPPGSEPFMTFNDVNDNAVLSVDGAGQTELDIQLYESAEKKPALQVIQEGTLTENAYGTFPTTRLWRLVVPDGHPIAAAVLQVWDNTNVGAPLITADNNTFSTVFIVGHEGGIGVFGHAAPTVPRTLAQSAITAITDANAKTAVQAIANALADMGALTLT